MRRTAIKIGGSNASCFCAHLNVCIFFSLPIECVVFFLLKFHEMYCRFNRWLAGWLVFFFCHEFNRFHLCMHRNRLFSLSFFVVFFFFFAFGESLSLSIKSIRKRWTCSTNQEMHFDFGNWQPFNFKHLISEQITCSPKYARQLICF